MNTNIRTAVLLIVISLFLMVVGYFALRKPTTEPTILPVANESEWEVYSGNSFEIKYPDNIFTLFDTAKYSTPKNKMNSTQIKLISSLRASNIGKEECIYYDKDNPKQICEVGPESGISFNETDGPILDYTSFIEKQTDVVIGGKQFIKTTIDVDDVGEMETYYISLNSNRTLIVSRLVRATFDSLRQDDFPQESLFNQVLSTLIIR